MGNQSSNSRDSAASDGTPDFSANPSIPTVDAYRHFKAYQHPWEARPSSHTEYPDRAVGTNSSEKIPRAQPIQTFNAKATVQTVGANVGGNVTAQNMTFIANAAPSFVSQTSRKYTFRLNIPTPTQHYKGRQDTLGKLQEFYDQLPEKSSDCWERIVAIVGLGGMGKTETACKYADQHRDAFPNAAWINAETEQGMLYSFLDLAKELGIAKENQKSADLNLVKKVYRFIDKEHNSNALFIFDNAIVLNSDGAEVGILDFLPTDDLPNRRFPNILITTQAPNWGRRIKTLQVEGLKQEEALEFYASCFKVKPSECTEEFKMLNNLLKGYPLCMNLAVSSIDFVPGKDSVHHLKQQIQLYIEEVEKEQERLTSEKIKPAWGHKYKKTLSTVWKLTQQRIQKEEDGPEALEILQIMSFLRLPVYSVDVGRILQANTDCPKLKDKNVQFRLKKLFRVLGKLYAVRILYAYEGIDNDVDQFTCFVGIHRLVQLVVRQQTNCNHALETLLCFVQIDEYPNGCVNLAAIEEALKNPRTQFTSRSLPYVAALAHKGNRSARNFFEARTPETEADATFWRLCSLIPNPTTPDVTAHQVIRELIGLTKSSERLVDRQFFTEMTLALAYPSLATKPSCKDSDLYKLNLNFDSLDDSEDLTVDIILSICSFHDSICEEIYCRMLDDQVVSLIRSVVVRFLQVDALKPKSVPVDRLAATWLAFLSKQRDDKSWFEWRWFWRRINGTFNSPDASPTRIAELRTCLWDHGLADELIRAFKSRQLDFYVKNRQIDSWCVDHVVPECFDVCFDGRHLLDMRVQEVISAFTEMTTNCYLETLNSVSGTSGHEAEVRWSLICQDCLVWIKLLLKDGDPTSESILECLSSCESLNCLEGIHEDSIHDIEGHIKNYFMSGSSYRMKYHSEYLGEFIRRYSSSMVRRIQALRTFCKIVLALAPPS